MLINARVVAVLRIAPVKAPSARRVCPLTVKGEPYSCVVNVGVAVNGIQMALHGYWSDLAIVHSTDWPWRQSVSPFSTHTRFGSYQK